MFLPQKLEEVKQIKLNVYRRKGIIQIATEVNEILKISKENQ